MANPDSILAMYYIQQALASFSGRSMRMVDSFDGVDHAVLQSFVSVMDTVCADLRVRNKGTQFETEATTLAHNVQRHLNQAAELLGMNRTGRD